MADLTAASVEDVASFFKTYYAPNNAVVAIVGDVDTKATHREGSESLRFDPLAAATADGWISPNRRRKANGDRRVDDPLARLARVDIVYKVPPRLTADDDAIQVLGTVLSSGRSSRLYPATRPRAATVAERPFADT